MSLFFFNTFAVFLLSPSGPSFMPVTPSDVIRESGSLYVCFLGRCIWYLEYWMLRVGVVAGIYCSRDVWCCAC